MIGGEYLTTGVCVREKRIEVDTYLPERALKLMPSAVRSSSREFSITSGRLMVTKRTF